MLYKVVAETLCFAVKIFYISINSTYLVFEGGRLCVGN